ncbi:MAG: HpcH/HpaI aldolase/citrate lyase family protein [Blastocatellia bacterium]
MKPEINILRSLLYVPGISEKMILKARDSAADALILDLEDAIAPEQKHEARATVARALREIDFGGKEVFVRINSLSTDLGLEDARAVAGGGVRGIVIPKSETVDDITTIAPMLHSGYGAPTGRLLCLIETPRGVFAARGLAESNELVIGLMFGSVDLSREMGGELSDNEEEVFFARSQVLLAARAVGVAAYDSPHFEIADLDGLRRRSMASRRLGYDGKTVIHPAHIEVVNTVFKPSPTQIFNAERTIAAMDDARIAGRGVALLDGRMIDQVHFTAAKKLLERARM